jgi:penicillin-binding protein 1C
MARWSLKVSKPHWRRLLRNTALTGAGCAVLFVGATLVSLKPIDASLHDIASDAQTLRVTDRTGKPLGISYQDRWNSFDHVALYDMPDLLKAAFLMSEDRRFYALGGVDWRARVSALRQNITSGKSVRGASTVTEQVVRMVNPRKRTLWSRWLEGFEAMLLERHAGKADILEFYLNQVPYAANRRGVTQAARYYFNRDLATLTPKEILALAVLVRAPSSYDPYRHKGRIDAPLARLAATLRTAGVLTPAQYAALDDETLEFSKAELPVEARHFARHVRLNVADNELYRTTLDATLQRQVQNLIDTRLKSLNSRNVHNAAVIVADHHSGEILAWVVGGANDGDDTPSHEFDTVTTPRQPGSAMKPFLYALALDKGWTAATLLDDSPLAEAVGGGLHNFRNYSNTYYGEITLREALGNSLNIPALLTIRHVGTGDYLTTLQHLGFKSLTRNSDIYDEGLALGNGEVTLLEMAQAYGALANRGLYQPFRIVRQQNNLPPPKRVYSDETASLMGNILSDPSARRMEFGAGSVLNLPVQTAAKTGTSTDYRDAWTLAYNDRYVVGIWMGNLDNTPMREITGSTGPALALRGIFALLNKNRDTDKLYLSPRLAVKDVCTRPPNALGECPMRSEWFAPGTIPQDAAPKIAKAHGYELVRPTDGLQIAYDPRIPASHQKFRFEIAGPLDGKTVHWTLDGKKLTGSGAPTLLWPVEKGRHTLTATVADASGEMTELPKATFIVK